jgi:hypothetical protein
MPDVTSVALLKTLYGATSVAILVSYLPQIRSVWRSRTGANDVSLFTWGVWGVVALVAALYAHVVVRDPGYALLSVGNAAGCFTVAGIATYKRFASAAR